MYAIRTRILPVKSQYSSDIGTYYWDGSTIWSESALTNNLNNYISGEWLITTVYGKSGPDIFVDNIGNIVSVAATDANATETANGIGVFTLTRTLPDSGRLAPALTVRYTLSGSAINGTDYNQLSGIATFGANSATTTINVVPVNDTESEGDETVILNISSASRYNTLDSGKYYDYYTGISISPNNTITIIDDDPANITLAVSPTNVTEDGTNNLIYTFTRTGATTSTLTVNYGITGTADSTDYTGATPGTGKTITFAAGSSTATLTIDPTADTTVEPDETVILTLASGTGYTVGTPNAATGTITNDDFPSITLAVSPSSVTEDGTTNLVYTFTRNGVTTNPLTVNYTVGGTATFSTDYTQTGAASYTATTGTVNFLAGSSTATVTVDPTADTTFETDETVILTLASGAGYTLGATTTATGTILNDDISVTPIETFGNTKLVQDTTNKLYAQIGNNNPIAIKVGATQITTNTYPGWQILAAETVNGINQVLLKNTTQNLLYIWNLDNNWNWQSSQGGWGLNSTQAFNQETNFKQDFNGDNQIGNPFTPIEAFGNTKLVKDTTNKLYTQIGNNNPIAIKVGATQITTNTYPGWQILAAETVNGINQVLLKNTSQNLLYIWNLDSNWNWQSSQGGWGLN
ncbi:Calx-beta domain-containing protein, partial [Microcystis aeruginosa]|uniref:Calx-beta domain-containing protein n=1 Tax=Microcystis aeruginosa TaxID=1126 RepID=UPI00278C087A